MPNESETKTVDAAPIPANAASPSTTPTAADTRPSQDPPLGPKPGDVGTPEWLNPRLEQAKRSERAALLKEIGVDDPAVARRALSDAKARSDAEKSATELLTAEKAAREQAEKEALSYRAALSAHVEAEFAKLTPNQQAFVEKHAGADIAKRISTIADMALLTPPAQTDGESRGPAQPPPPPPQPAPAKILPSPASTAAGGAPPGGAPPPPVDHLAVLGRLEDRNSGSYNPVAAGHYYSTHMKEITRLRAAQTAGSTSQ